MSHLKLARRATGEPEIFVSIQGEGVTAGVPSTFVRLSICNLSCVWCDTRYTWDWRNYDPKAEIIAQDVDDVAERVEALNTNNVVLTGGEPLLQMRGMEELAGRLHAAGHRIEVETNGTVQPSAVLAEAVSQWNVSPKLRHAGNAPQRSEDCAAIGWFASSGNAFFKFVVQEPDDVAEVRDYVCRHDIVASRVMLMPEGTDKRTLAARSEWLVPMCLENKYRYLTRLHVLLWGNERGK